MYKFEECYSATRNTLKTSTAHKKIPGLRSLVDWPVLFGAEGPSRSHAAMLDQYRRALVKRAEAKVKGEGAVLVDAAGGSSGSRHDRFVRGLNDEVAALKMARHLYLVHARGGQDVWFYSPPKNYTEWVQDEFTGLGQLGLSTWAGQTEEVYTREDMRAMGEATQMALAWTMKCITRLGGTPNSRTQQVVQRWFCADGASEADQAAARKTLLAGFGKIAAVLNSGLLVLSDEPGDRNNGGWKDYAFVYKGEKMNVIYIQQATLSAALGNRMWDAALTIVHELSHRELNTEDHRYADRGPISPGSVRGLSPAKAITNADSWGYFAADMNHALPRRIRTSATGLAA